MSGIIERMLFTTLAIVLLAGESNGGAKPAIPGAVCIALEGFKRDQVTENSEYVTIHPIWGSGVSMAFAVLGGWLFNEIVRI